MKHLNEQKTDTAPRCTEQQLVGIRDALLTLHITGDRLFVRIREDLERGLISEARTQLNFVDKIVNANAPHRARAIASRPECGCSAIQSKGETA